MRRPPRPRNPNVSKVFWGFVLAILLVVAVVESRKYALNQRGKHLYDKFKHVEDSTTGITQTEILEGFTACLQQTTPEGALLKVDPKLDTLVQVNQYTYMIKGTFTLSGEMYDKPQHYNYTCNVIFDELHNASCDDLQVK